MLLNENSWVKQLYNWFYCVHRWDNLPFDGCDYFRKLIWMFLVIVPYVILSLPFIIINACCPKHNKLDADYAIERPLLGIALPIFIFLIGIILYTFIYPVLYLTNIQCNDDILMGSAVTWGMVLFFGSLFLVIKLLDNLKYSDTLSKIGEVYKSFKDKYCIKIEWTKK